MEISLRFELENIQELNDKVFPIDVPEGELAPYLVYIGHDYRPLKTLEGTKQQVNATYLLNIFSDSYPQLSDLTKKVKAQILTFPLRTIGNSLSPIYVEDLTINNIVPTYENELKLYRSIIDFEITYKEE